MADKRVLVLSVMTSLSTVALYPPSVESYYDARTSVVSGLN